MCPQSQVPGHNGSMDEGRGSVDAHTPAPPDPRRRPDQRGGRPATPPTGRPPVGRTQPIHDRRGDDDEGDSTEDEQPAPRPGRTAAVAAGRGALATGRGVAKGSKAVGRVTAAASRKTVRVARRATEAQGAGESGLARLIQVHAFSSAGDTAVIVGLAGTLFFQVPTGEARGQVTLFLLLTMLPFAIVAPLLGPLLDRFRHGRRWSIGATLSLRAFLCWVLAQSISDQSSWQFPAALGVLVAGKAYLITRSSATPRLLPDGLTLVKANGRLSLAGTVGAGIGGGIAGVAATFGSAWALRVAFVLFVIGTVLAIMLPERVDSSVGEQQAPMRDLAASSTGGMRRGISGEVVTALRANSGLRWLSGFLTIFMAFLMREHPFPGWEDRGSLLLALVIGAAGVGNAIGTMAGALVKVSSPRVIVLATLLADAAMVVVAALMFGLPTAIAVGLVAGVGQQMGKLALDALIQDTVPEHVRTSVFARSETLLQLSWVLGGIVAVAIPLNAKVGMTTAAVLLVLWTIAVIVWHTGRSLPVPQAAKPQNVMARRRARRASDANPPDTAASSAEGRSEATDPRGPAPRRTRPIPQAPEQRAPHATKPVPRRPVPPPQEVYDDEEYDDTEPTLPINRTEDPWQPPRRSGDGQDDDRRDRWSSRFRG